jgi:hypothetical protein
MLPEHRIEKAAASRERRWAFSTPWVDAAPETAKAGRFAVGAATLVAAIARQQRT